MAAAGVNLRVLQRVAGHQDHSRPRYLHPDTQATLERPSRPGGPEQPALSVIKGGRDAG
jgi:hypothetical protein